MNKFRIISMAFAILLVSFRGFSAEVTETSSHTYTTIPFYEMIDSDRMDLIEKTQGILVQELRQLLPEGKITKKSLQLLEDNSKRITEVVESVSDYTNEKLEKHRFLQNFFSARDLIPSAFMLMVGGKISANFKIGGGASGTVALLVIPAKVIKVNKLTRKTVEYYTLNMGLSVIPVLNIGGGLGGGATYRAGVGVIWGKISKPSDFYGLNVGTSLTGTYGAGYNVKLSTLSGLKGIKNIFATGMFQAGASAEVSAHLNIGGIVTVNEFSKAMDLASGAVYSIKDIMGGLKK